MTKASPDDSGTRNAKSLIRKRDFNGAVQVLQKLLDESPNDADALELLGTVYFFSRQYELARDTFQELTTVDPFRASAWINMGAVLNKMGDHKRAIDVLRKGLQRDRQNAEGYYNMAMAQRALKLNTMAVSAYKEAIKFKPEMIDAHLNLGMLYAELRNNKLAQQCYQAVLHIDPNHKKARSLLGMTQDLQKKARDAVSPFGRLVDTAELETQKEDSGPRMLDAVQRVEERELIQAITKRIRPSAKGLVPLLEGEVPEILHRLEIITKQDANKFAEPATHRQLVELIEQLKDMRADVANGFDEIRAHLDQTG